MINILWGLMGCTIIVLVAYLMSENKKAINIWTVSVGFIAQVVLGFFVLKWDVGMSIIEFLSDGVAKVMAYGVEGLSFVFGSLADKGGAAGPIFAINALAIMIYLTALIGLLYHFGIMQWFVRIVGGSLSKIMKTGHIESTNAAANIFLGMTQSFLSVKPYIKTMSRSQLFAVMVGGLASVSGAVLLGLAAMGIPINYLLSAAIMSAPAGLMLAKLIIPETEKLDPNEWKVVEETTTEIGEKDSVMEVIVNESKEGMKFAVNAAVILVSIIGLIALLNGILGGVGSLVGFSDLSFELILGYVFAPVAFILGIPWSEAVYGRKLTRTKNYH